MAIVMKKGGTCINIFKYSYLDQMYKTQVLGKRLFTLLSESEVLYINY